MTICNEDAFFSSDETLPVELSGPGIQDGLILCTVAQDCAL